jgi:hypothetical protein
VPRELWRGLETAVWATDHRVALVLPPAKRSFAFLVRPPFSKEHVVVSTNGDWGRTINFTRWERNPSTPEEFRDVRFLKKEKDSYEFTAFGGISQRRYLLAIAYQPTGRFLVTISRLPEHEDG